MVVTSTYLLGAAFARSSRRARAVHRLFGGAGGGAETGLLGTGPERCRSAWPRVKARGRVVCGHDQAQRESVTQTSSCTPCGAPANEGGGR